MQSIQGTPRSGYNRYNRAGAVVGGAYTVAEMDAALKAGRYETFRHELHRIVGGLWTVVANLDKAISKCEITYDRTGTSFMRSAKYEIWDDGTTINWRTDAIRTFWQLQMPDGNYAEWMMGTFYLNSPTVPLRTPLQRTVDAYDALVALDQSKITDWLTIPSTPLTGGWDAGDPVGWAIGLIQDRYPLAGIDIPATAIRIPSTAAKLYEPGTSLLDIINELLVHYCNYEFLHANVTGSLIAYPYVPPSQRAVEYTYTSDSKSLLVYGSGQVNEDVFNAPNQWVATVSRPDRSVLRARYTLDDPANPISTTYRGRTVTVNEVIDVADQATLNAYVKRRAEEGQRIIRQVQVGTPLMPSDHADCIRLVYAGQSWQARVDGTYVEKGWTFPCEPGGQMVHQLELTPMTVVTV